MDRIAQNEKGQAHHKPDLHIAGERDTALIAARQAAFEALAAGSANSSLNYIQGQFLGGLAFMDGLPSPRQLSWLDSIRAKLGLPPFDRASDACR